MNRAGQVLIEHLLTMAFVLIPLFYGVFRWGNLEYRRSQCALRAFQEARRELIRSALPASVSIDCGNGVLQEAKLRPLQELDRGADGLSFSDLASEASSLWEALSSLESPASEPDSGPP